MDIEQYRRELRINKHRLDDALETHSEAQEQISAEVARLNTDMLRSKENLAQVEARLLQDIKDNAERMTKDEAEARVTRHKERREAWADLQAARELLERWQGLYAAWMQRGKDLKELGHLYGTQYFALTSVGPSTERAPMRRDYTTTTPRRRSVEAD